MDNFRVEQKLRDGWKTISEDTNGAYGGQQAGVSISSGASGPNLQPRLPSPTSGLQGSVEPEPSDVVLTPTEKKAVFAMLQAALTQMQMDGAIASASDVSPDLESAMTKMR